VIAIVQYGLGNVHAIANIYKQLNIPTVLATDAATLLSADHIVLPGVGAFDWAMTRLVESGMRAALDAAVLQNGTPVLGICVGMQMMADRSEEGQLPGLGWVRGEVRRMRQPAGAATLQLPHMGWNDVCPNGTPALLDWMGESGRFYFLHSYYFVPADASNLLTSSDYGGAFASGVTAHGNVFGVQFHPEKSHQWGVSLLRRFAELDRC
jgi:glutamine amidotransferase